MRIYTYDQINSQITDVTGEYSFPVPEGTYHLKVKKWGFKPFTGDQVIVAKAKPFHQNIKLTKKTSSKP